MAIETRTINGSLTEIYVGGGNWITQSAPTNFHQFYKRKILTASENISDFKEVTAAQKAQIEATDAKWERPPQSFIDMWDRACLSFGYYNEATGYFELNGLTDITYEQAGFIMAAGARQTSTLEAGYISNSKIRTHLPRVGAGQAADANSTFRNCSNIEVVEMRNLRLKGWAFAYCGRLRSICVDAPLYSLNGSASPNFTNCINLVDLCGAIRGNYGIDIADSPLLSLGSLIYMTENAYNTAPITITLHPDAYARLTDELIAAAAEKQITFVTT